MKCTIGLSISILISVGCTPGVLAQSGQSPTLQQATSTTDTRQAHPPKPILKKVTGSQRRKLEAGVDSTLPKNRKRKLPADSLRRGGATRVDTIR